MNIISDMFSRFWPDRSAESFPLVQLPAAAAPAQPPAAAAANDPLPSTMPRRKAKPRTSKRADTRKAGAARKAKRGNFAKRCRDLFAEGKSNEETWTILRGEFSYAEDAPQKTYPTWYRSHLARQAKKAAKESDQRAAMSEESTPPVQAVD